ncbi:LptA/OstA family protein [Novosphingobium sp. M1R2S20]|uniref:LptA/OstA family protein n=1 Tax=Novosphingobium rhizovicinum TaxID=3228928 RepID=A0ABV3R9K7_9SPHN
MTPNRPRAPFFRSLWLRTGLLAGTAAALALAGAQQLGAQALSGHNANAPVDYAADRIELQDRQERVILSGNVDVRQSDLRLRAARTIVEFTDAGGSLQIQRITASGGVNVTRGNEVATGDVAIYDFNRRIITMVGNATLKRNGDTLRGNRFVVDLNSGVSSAEGRVTGTFSVPKN